MIIAPVIILWKVYQGVGVPGVRGGTRGHHSHYNSQNLIFGENKYYCQKESLLTTVAGVVNIVVVDVVVHGGGVVVVFVAT